jgi:Cu-Zn family superoxide dismutase
MRTSIATTALAAVAFLGLTAADGDPDRTGPGSIPGIPADDVPASAWIHTTSGEWIGTIDFVPLDAERLFVSLHVEGQTPGLHGFHIHDRGSCASTVDAVTGLPVPFGGAGGHYDPGLTMDHGHPDQPAEETHGGDLPNIVVDGHGDGDVEYTTTDFALEGARSIIGRSVIVHALEDDYVTDPAGNSGARIGCGVIVAVP